MITTVGCAYQDSAAYITEEGPREEAGARQRRRSSHGPLPRMAPRKSDLGTPTNAIAIAVKIRGVCLRPREKPERGAVCGQG